MPDILEIDSIIQSFGSRQILNDIYLKCETGEVVGILGRNGSGKSTLLKIIFGTQHAYNKSIRINTKAYDCVYKTPSQIAYLPQHSFLPRNISLKGIVNLYIPEQDKRENIFANAHVLPHLKKCTTELSGGELRYFEILLLLHTNAKFVLLDEPFNGIEPIYREEIKQLIWEWRSKKGFIITDHDYHSIIDSSSRILLIYDGTLKKITRVNQLEGYNYVPSGTFTKKKEISQNHPDVPFDVDKQTLKDLELFDQGKGGDVFSIFNHVKTIGGFNMLHKLLCNPVTNKEILIDRSNSIRFFTQQKTSITLNKAQFDFIEHYLATNIPVLKNNPVDVVIHHIRNRIKPTNDNYIIETGIKYLIDIFLDLSVFLNSLAQIQKPDYLSNRFFEIQNILNDEKLSIAIHTSGNEVLSPFRFAFYDKVFRIEIKEKIREVIDFLYEMDVFVSVADAASRHNLSFAEYLPEQTLSVKLHSLFHPLLKNAVANDFEFSQGSTLCFLSGANMSGKSTFLKSFGLAVYLAHVGFPVPAKAMQTTIFNGLVTTINLPDNITQGYSHFYSEVRRVKETAIKVQSKGRMIVIFDELFRGTNVKDATDASLVIIAALSKIQSSRFMISTHIVEIAEELKACSSVFFRCFESALDGDTPVYNYKLSPGISKERLGMQILRNEKIIEILEKAENQPDYLSPN